MTQAVARFGDFFHEIPEPEIFYLPRGGVVSSECVVNSLGLTYAIEVIPRQPMIDTLAIARVDKDIALGFRVIEEVGTDLAAIYLEPVSGLFNASNFLGHILASSLPEIRQAA